MSKYNKEYQQSYYQKHREEKIQYAKNWASSNPQKRKKHTTNYRASHPLTTEQRAELRKLYPGCKHLIRAIALSYGCQNPNCPCRSYGYVVVELDFHHLTGKEYSISKMSRKRKSLIAAEINKCVVLCANCHRRTHAGLVEVDETMLCCVNDELNLID